MKRDLSRGSVLGNIIVFSVPYFLSCFLQMLYGLADLFIIGQFAGVDSTTAVSVGSQVMHMVTVMITGLAMGSSVMTGRAVGAKDDDKVSRTVGNTITIFALIAVTLAAVLLLLVGPITKIVRTPIEAVPEARIYLLICFSGIPFIVAYNVIASIFQGMGDSKSPMWFILVACVCNIALDWLFIGSLGMRAAGAALGTTLSQAISVITALIAVRVKKMIRMGKKDLRPDKDTCRAILSVGFPITLQNGFIQVAFLFITAIANMRGLTDAAAVGIVEKVIGMLFLVPSALLSSVSAISSICIGAGDEERSRKTLRTAIMLAVIFGFISSVAVDFMADGIVSLFVGAEETGVIRGGGQYLRAYVWDCLFAGMHFSFSGWFSAMGRSRISFIHNMISILVARIPLAWLASIHFPDNLFPMGCATVIGSMVSVVVCVLFYLSMEKKRKASLQK